LVYVADKKAKMTFRVKSNSNPNLTLILILFLTLFLTLILIQTVRLESNTKGPLMTKMMNAFLSKGFSGCLISFRGCGDEENLTPGGYHLGFTRDVDQVCEHLNQM
jgi:predicted alpha/beta-fold hydrolase